MSEIRFFVPGIPAPQGSKKYVGNGRMIESSKAVRPWRDTITYHAQQAAEDPAWGGPYLANAVQMTFVLPRPKSVTVKSRPLPTVKPDIDKLVRAVLDALTASRIYHDDASVVEIRAEKKYEQDGWSPGVWVRVTAA